MNETAIRAEGIGKKYKILHNEGNASDSLIDAFTGGISKMFRNHGRRSKEEFWALRDINFEISKGDRVGIIGRNGAGKSTLLKILSRIVHPSTGSLEYHGRMASLLEVGTGFHGDLTGRENIFLNGSILGMSRHEIASKFDEIVAFSEISQFVDTPVKRYSSGMYVRLAFAVAAHIDPEILVVDEVLAVGDSAFQKKCLGKMKEISEGRGRTILFVSHNLAAVQNLCNKSMVIEKGKVTCPLTDTESAVKHYLKEVVEVTGSDLSRRTDRSGEGLFRFDRIVLKDSKGDVIPVAQSGADLVLEVSYTIGSETMSNVTVAITVYTDEGREMFTLANGISGSEFAQLGRNQVMQCRVNRFPLSEGSYVCNIIAYKDGVIQDYIRQAYILTVEPGDFFGSGRSLPPEHRECFLVPHEWTIERRH
jgi:lipopolysaccharide transport system ATP-binding protein